MRTILYIYEREVHFYQAHNRLEKYDPFFPSPICIEDACVFVYIFHHSHRNCSMPRTLEALLFPTR